MKAQNIIVVDGKTYVPGKDQLSCQGCAFEDFTETPQRACEDVTCIEGEGTYNGRTHIWVEKSE